MTTDERAGLSPMREHMKGWAQRLVDGEDKPDPVEDTAEDVWASLRMFADQYLELLADYEKVA